jgi:multicomponent Na+:H+ antiporter subunit G
MKDLLVALLVLFGCLAVLLAAVGLVRFPDFFTRTHAATKASAFGIGLLVIAVCVEFPAWNVIAKSIFALIALFLTLPVASQALADAERDHRDVPKPRDRG